MIQSPWKKTDKGMYIILTKVAKWILSEIEMYLLVKMEPLGFSLMIAVAAFSNCLDSSALGHDEAALGFVVVLLECENEGVLELLLPFEPAAGI